MNVRNFILRFLAFLILVISSVNVSGVKAADVGLSMGQVPPALNAVDTQGKKHQLEDYQGKLIVLHFWATWCPYCRKEMPKLKQVQAQFADEVKVLAVSVDEDESRLKQFLEKESLPYTVLVDAKTDFELARNYGISGIPVTYIINREGKIAKRAMGPIDIVTDVELNLK